VECATGKWVSLLVFDVSPLSLKALGINALHTMGIIHRDIKSENILIDMQENVRITDFGLSYIDKEPKPLHTWWGYAYDLTGTINFMAPEILYNAEQPLSVKYGAPADWWGFGCVLYELISPPKHKARIASHLVVILLILPRQELFASEDDIMEYVAWHSKNYGRFGLFPSFQRLDPIAADLVAEVSSFYYVISPSLTLTVIVA
jgi:serine/threonine protein kinase